MRPIVRGQAPRTYSQYGDSLDDLVSRIGPFCSYCGLRLSHLLEVEHVKPKTHFPQDELNWDNFLLSCKYCNTIKSDRPKDAISNYLWPHLDNPLTHLEWIRLGPVAPRSGLSHRESELARLTLDLSGINRHPNSPEKPTKKDRRWRGWDEVWIVAEECRRDVLANPSDELMKLVGRLAFGFGCFPIWLQVFSNIPGAVAAILAVYPGTCNDCFKSGQPIPRK